MEDKAPESQEIEKKKKLKERRQAIAQKYREDKKTGQDKNRQLYFFTYIIKVKGHTYKSAAEAAGVSPQLLNWWIMSDYTYLGNIQKVLNAIGVSIEPSFKEKQTQKINGLYRIQGDISQGNVYERFNLGTEEVNKLLKNGGRLLFLAKFIQNSNHTVHAICKKAGISYQQMVIYLRNDDIPTNKIYKISEAFDLELIWNVNNIQDSEE